MGRDYHEDEEQMKHSYWMGIFGYETFQELHRGKMEKYNKKRQRTGRLPLLHWTRLHWPS